MFKVKKIDGHPRKELFTQREAGHGAAQGQSLAGPTQSPGFHPKHHKKREKKKSVTNEGSNTPVDARGPGDPLTAGKADRDPTQSSLVILKMSS